MKIDEALKKVLAPSFFALVIAGLSCISGLYTFSGINLLVDQRHLAIVLAAVVQLTILTTIMSLPFVKGILKPFLFFFYIGFLLISATTAYIFIFNEQTHSGEVASYDVTFVARVSDYITALNRAEMDELAAQREIQEAAKSAMKEEKNRGLRSRLGPGQGDEFLRKEEAYEAATRTLATMQEKHKIFQGKYNQIRILISGPTTSQVYAENKIAIAELGALAAVDNPDLRNAVDAYYETLKSPVERAIDPLKKGDVFSVTVASSIIWSVIFDTASLVMGLIWIQLMIRPRPFLDVLNDKLRHTMHGLIRLKRLPKEVIKSTMLIDDLVMSDQQEKIYRFGSRILGVCRSVSHGENLSDPLDPLKMVVARLRVLNSDDALHGSLANNESIVGILTDEVDNDALLRAILAIMTMEKLFVKNQPLGAYVLNIENEFALDIVFYLINSDVGVDATHIKDFHSKLVEKRIEQSGRLLEASYEDHTNDE